MSMIARLWTSFPGALPSTATAVARARATARSVAGTAATTTTTLFRHQPRTIPPAAARMSSNTTHPPAHPQQDGPLQHPPPPPQKPIFFGPFDVTNQVFLTTPHSFALVNLKPLLPGHVLVCPLRPHQRLTDLSPAEVTDLFSAVQRVQRMLARHYFHPLPPSPSPGGGGPPNSTQSNDDDDYLHPLESSHNNTNPPGAATTTTHPGGAFNIALQDGPEAGQTVPHVHVHVIPRIVGSTAKPPSTPSDAIYEQMAGEEGNVGGALYDSFLRAGRPRPGGSFPPIEDAERRARGMGEMEEEAGVYRAVLERMDAEGAGAGAEGGR